MSQSESSGKIFRKINTIVKLKWKHRVHGYKIRSVRQELDVLANNFYTRPRITAGKPKLREIDERQVHLASVYPDMQMEEVTTTLVTDTGR